MQVLCIDGMHIGCGVVMNCGGTGKSYAYPPPRTAVCGGRSCVDGRCGCWLAGCRCERLAAVVRTNGAVPVGCCGAEL